MKTILVLISEYYPGQKNGGPTRTIMNLSEALGDDYDIRILCLNKSAGDAKPYSSVDLSNWNNVGKSKVFYINKFSVRIINHFSKNVDVVYACCLFSQPVNFALLAKRLNKLHRKPLIVASMGVFAQGAMCRKTFKKRIYIFVCKLFGLFRGIIWSVSTELEERDLKKYLGQNANCIIAEDLPRQNIPGFGTRDIDSRTIVFLSRICKSKNLIGAIRALSNIKYDIVFDIFGPKEDVSYWNQCEEELKKLPRNIRWHYYGEINTELVQETLQKYNLFLFPTFGENYGHVIFEALSVACIPLISDQTPWEIIKTQNAGYVLPLTNDMSSFSSAITTFFELNHAQKLKMMESAVTIAKEKVQFSRQTTGYREVFER